MIENEIWKPCGNTDGLLEASNLGRVRSVTREGKTYKRERNGRIQGNVRAVFQGKVLSQCKTTNGYMEVAISYGGKRRKFAVHRLVAHAFSDGYFDGAHVDHIDGDKTNNAASNLEWVTAAENTRRQWEMGLVDLRGELAPGAKLSNLQAHAIMCLRANGFPAAAVANWFGVSTAAVYKIESGKRHITGHDYSLSAAASTSSTRRSQPRPNVEKVESCR